jgi:hypothetical protein
MLKYIVICGPNVYIEIPEVQERFRTLVMDITENSEKPLVVAWPEAYAGAQAVRDKIHEIANAGKSSCIFLTRYEHVVSELANMVAAGTLRADQVVFCLWRDNVGFTEHQMDGEFVGNNWPMGILW